MTDNNTKTAADQVWDETLNSKEGREVLEQMADEALAEFDEDAFVPMDHSTEK